ncbi:MAG: outer membrane beta-barrel protein [Acidobacteria bacterium]|nr:outer membrane beta-barrel protein [Acidobacteriota bacterium]
MIRTRFLPALLLIAVVGVLPDTARAQGVRVFAMGSGSLLLSEKFFEVAGDPFRSNYAPGGKIIFGGEYSANKVLGFEAAYAYGRNNLRISDLEEAPIEEAGYGVRIQRLNGNLVLHSPVEVLRLRPYVTAGIEFTRYAPTREARDQAFAGGFAGQSAVLEANNKPGINYGGGVEWSLLPALALRLDVRDHATGTPRFGLPQDSSNGAFFPISGSAHNVEISAGFTLHFGD